MQDNSLRLIDIFVYEEDKTPILDITLYNQGNQVVLPTRAKIEILDVGEFYDCDDDGTRAFIPVTRAYGVVLSPSSRGQEQVVKIAHLLRPEESDRFQLVLSQRIDNPALVYVWYRLKVTIVYDEQARNITSQPILLSIPPVNPKQYDIWEIGDDSCIVQNKATLIRMASQVANRSRSVEAAIQANTSDSEKRAIEQTHNPGLAVPGEQAATLSIDDPIEIFFSYAKEDELLVKRLDEQLAVSQRSKLITNWHTGKIALGKNVNQETLHHLHQAHIILLLISPSFMASPQYAIIDNALKQRNVHQNAVIIPVLLRPTANWQSTSFGQLQFTPKNGKAITTWTPQDAAFAQVAEEIVETVKALKVQKHT